MDLKIYYNYDVDILIPQNTEIGEPELKNIGEKTQDKNDLIIHNTIINARQKPFHDMMQGCVHLFQEL